MQRTKVPARAYVSPVRVAAAAEKRRDVLAAAIGVLREDGDTASFALETIAKRAGVTRLTVYNQFGSRRGLLEAVLDELAARSELARLAEANDDPDACRSLDRIVEVICAFWSFDPAIGRLQAATALDREFAEAVRDRTERRRALIRSVVHRLHPAQATVRQGDIVDLIFSLTAYATFRSLGESRTSDEVCSLLKRACRRVAFDDPGSG